MDSGKKDAVIAGLICLDIIPAFPDGTARRGDLFVPGGLLEVGDAVLSTGGAASNTGLAMHRLGFPVSIIGKVGDDVFGDAVLRILAEHGESLASDMIVAPGEGTSYSIVISPPGADRMFLHFPGANHTFAAHDVPDSALAGARLLHFGYPPLMRNICRENGEELKTLFRRARNLGLTVSLDMARPDPDGPSGKVDWRKFLENVLPMVDVFVPSFDETLLMLDPGLFRKWFGPEAECGGGLDIEVIRGTADALLSMGPAMVGFKLGDQGFFLRTTADADRLAGMGGVSPGDVEAWTDAELIAPCRRVTVAGATGAGDCTIAGFLGALLKGLSPDAAVAMAVATGASGVERPDAFSGVPAWEEVTRRLEAGWPELPSRTIPADWICAPEGTRRRGRE